MMVQRCLKLPVGGEGQRPDETEFHDGVLLVRQTLQEVRNPLAVLDPGQFELCEGELPGSGSENLDVGAVRVDVDEQDVAGLDFPEVGRFGGAGVADPASCVDHGGRVSIAEGHVVEPSIIEAHLEVRNGDQGRIVRVGCKGVDTAVADDDPDRAVGWEVSGRPSHKIGVRMLREPRCADDLDPRFDGDRLGIGDDHDVVGTTTRERVGREHRTRIERVMVAGKEVEGDLGESRHGIEGPDHDLSVHLVGLKDVAANDDERRAMFLGESADRTDGIEARNGEPGLCLRTEEMPGHAELPVGGVNESCHGRSVRKPCDILLNVTPPRGGMGSIEALSAVTLAVSDMDRSVAFYAGCGFEVAFGGAGTPFTSLRAGDGFVNLQLDPDHAPLLAIWGRVIFWVDDVDAAYGRVVAAGGVPDAEPADAPWGERYFHVRDPDGHELSFARPLG